ncbi:SRPBCC domain-containing protein [Adhaeribacter sp. BT258]|uniref:SRPBCC domain-containing protein n=1 Tax=Adhaeribacter terrigena TaxID=2793070 RepID=A0ABS1BZH1_9BACT|nr:SRPBCC domain-containing protein [Adhaeribacter terrigena]MBK0402321.1 SRPBCC domain-containing protein [Adhaeribacter terrigena]
MEKLEIRNSITINADPTKVWEVLTQPEQTKKYMFGCEAISDWKPGSPLLWQMQHEGKDFVPVKGNIVAIQPEEMLAYTVFDPHTTIPDIPENYLTVTYALTSDNGKTNLTVTQGDFKIVENGEKRYQEMYNNGEGWTPILVQIKKVAEKS